MANRPYSVVLSLTVSGLNFHTKDLTATSQVAFASCSTASWVSGTSVACFVGSTGSPGDTFGVVTISALVGTSVGAFSFDGMFRSAPSYHF